MNALEFYSRLISGITGIPAEHVKQYMFDYEKYVGNDGCMHFDVPLEDMKKISEIAKTDPNVFLNWVTEGQIKGIDCTTKH
jgi:hypothetical protein